MTTPGIATEIETETRRIIKKSPGLPGAFLIDSSASRDTRTMRLLSPEAP